MIKQPLNQRIIIWSVKYGSCWRYDTKEIFVLFNQLWPLVNDRLNFLTSTRRAIGWGTGRKVFLFGLSSCGLGWVGWCWLLVGGAVAEYGVEDIALSFGEGLADLFGWVTFYLGCEFN